MPEQYSINSDAQTAKEVAKYGLSEIPTIKLVSIAMNVSNPAIIAVIGYELTFDKDDFQNHIRIIEKLAIKEGDKLYDKLREYIVEQSNKNKCKDKIYRVVFSYSIWQRSILPVISKRNYASEPAEFGQMLAAEEAKLGVRS